MIDTIEIKWDLLGARLAALSDEEQAAFFKGFAAELDHYGSRYKAEMQLAAVHNQLSPKTRETLKELFPMLWCDGEEGDK